MAAPRSMIDLARGEPVLWEGAPDPSKHFTRGDFFLVPFYLFFLAFSIVFTMSVIRGGAPAFFALFGGMFIAAGLFFAFGRFFVKAWVKARTRYALTPTRAIILGPRSTREVRLGGQAITVTTSNAQDVVTVVFSSGHEPRGGLFGSRGPMHESLRNSGLDSMVGGFSPAFYDVRDVAGLRAALDRVR